MSYDDLRNLLGAARLQVQAFNVGADTKYAEESLSVSRGRDTMKFNLRGSDLGFAGAPDEATYVWYRYYAIGVPLSEIEIRLSDHERSISISGQPQVVQSAWTVLSTSLSEHETVLRGSRWRFILYIPVVLLGVGLMALGGIDESPVKRRWLRHVLYLAGLSLFGAWVVVPDGFLSGTLVVSGSPSFVNRHATAITVSGLVLSLLGLIQTVEWVLRWMRRSPPPPPPAPAATPRADDSTAKQRGS